MLIVYYSMRGYIKWEPVSCENEEHEPGKLRIATSVFGTSYMVLLSYILRPTKYVNIYSFCEDCIYEERKRKMDRISKQKRQLRHLDQVKALNFRLQNLEQHILKRSARLHSFHSGSGRNEARLEQRPCTDLCAIHYGALTDYRSNEKETSTRQQHISDSITEILSSVHLVDSSAVCLNDAIIQNALIRGVVEGWDYLQRIDYVCPLWDILRRLDVAMNISSGSTTRLALLRGVQLILLVCVREPFHLFEIPDITFQC